MKKTIDIEQVVGDLLDILEAEIDEGKCTKEFYRGIVTAVQVIRMAKEVTDED